MPSRSAAMMRSAEVTGVNSPTPELLLCLDFCYEFGSIFISSTQPFIISPSCLTTFRPPLLLSPSCFWQLALLHLLFSSSK